ncbi:MAG: hypothetical protein K2Y40_12650 [Reyranella sp.]|nr:hypothetical protein [Reyranella sp.]
MSAARVRCPVLTCTNEMAADGLMCIVCWQVLPTYQRVSVEACAKAARRQPTARNRQRLAAAVSNARRAAATVQS